MSNHIPWYPVKCGTKLLIHSQNSAVPLYKGFMESSMYMDTPTPYMNGPSLRLEVAANCSLVRHGLHMVQTQLWRAGFWSSNHTNTERAKLPRLLPCLSPRTFVVVTSWQLDSAPHNSAVKLADICSKAGLIFKPHSLAVVATRWWQRGTYEGLVIADCPAERRTGLICPGASPRPEALAATARTCAPIV